MKCPKCGYNSFEIHDTCKKCANDLTSYKDIHGLKSIVLPQEARADLAEKLMSDCQPQHEPAAAVMRPQTCSRSISPKRRRLPSSLQQDDPFNFDDQPPAPVLAVVIFPSAKSRSRPRPRPRKRPLPTFSNHHPGRRTATA